MNTPVSSPILFHCWQHKDIGGAREILESICKNGLLLTTNSKTLDTFSIDRGKGVEPMEVMQNPRVCFTDIPIHLLASHGQRYGNYGVGFRRETVIDWGGMPAWYLPNYWGDKTLKCVGSALVNGLHAARDMLGQFQANAERYIAEGYEAKGIPFPISLNYPNRPPMRADEFAEALKPIRTTILSVLSFIKEMSPQTAEDHSYLLEREWRITTGLDLAGHPSAFRALTQAEKDSLCAKRPAWQEARQSQDANITATYGAASIIGSFRYFNGLPAQETVSQLIDTILVPDESEAHWVRKFLSGHAGYFRTATPSVIIFPVAKAEVLGN